ncbi:MAG TPA: hypothetical protein VIJ82_03675 [Streptosporangiaceae bacterium]|jgi:hypothetical protein
MTGWQALEQFLRTDPRDVGCEQAMEVLEAYVELILGDEISGDIPGTAQRRFPGVAAHLLACGPCGEDLQGLAAAARRPDSRS